jgi:hypothetical protein
MKSVKVIYKYCVLAVMAVVLYGCGASIPECNSADAQKYIKKYYYQYTEMNPEFLQISLNRISTENINKEAKNRKCAVEISVDITQSGLEKLKSDALDNAFADALILKNNKSESEIIFHVKYDENTKKYFIQFSDINWPEEVTLLDTNTSGLIIMDALKQK